MNARFPLLAVALLWLGLMVSACSKDNLTKDLDVRLVAYPEINVSGGDPLEGTWQVELDPLANADIRDNRDKIKDVVLQRLTYKVEDYIGAGGTTATGAWRYYPADAPSEAQMLGTVTTLNFQDLKTSGTEQELAVDENARKKLVELVKAGRKVVIAFQGSVTDQPTWARFGLRIYTRVQVGT